MAEAPPGARPVDEFDWSTAKPIGSPGVIARARDAAISAGKGVIGVGEAALGLADIVTLGRAGKAAEALGVDPKAAKEFLSEGYSAEQKAANRAVQDAEGVGGTLSALAQNPSTLVQGLIESAPSMLAGGAISRAIPAAQAATATAAATRGLSPVIRGAIGEASVTAGATAEQVRQETGDGLLTPQQAAIAAGSGALTGGLSMGSGAIAKKLGLADLETWMAGGGAGSSARGRLARGAGGALSEGVLEEAPQSFQEQVAQNLALGKPWAEDAPEAAAFGGVLGAVLGGGLGAVSRGEKPKITPEEHAIEAARRPRRPSPTAKKYLKSSACLVQARLRSRWARATSRSTCRSSTPLRTPSTMRPRSSRRAPTKRRGWRGSPPTAPSPPPPPPRWATAPRSRPPPSAWSNPRPRARWPCRSPRPKRARPRNPT